MWLYKVLSTGVYLMCAQKKNFCTICTFQAFELSTATQGCTPTCLPQGHSSVCQWDQEWRLAERAKAEGKLRAPWMGRTCEGPQMPALVFSTSVRHLAQLESFISGLIRGLSFSALGWAKIEHFYLHEWNYLHHKSTGPEVQPTKSSGFNSC